MSFVADDAPDYPDLLNLKPLNPAVDVEVGLINIGLALPSGEEVEIRGDIVRLGRMADGTLAIDVQESCWDTVLTVPLDWVDYGAAECPRDWSPTFPTEGELRGLRFVIHDELEALSSLSAHAGT